MTRSTLAGLERIARERGETALAVDIAEANRAAEAGQFTLALLGQFKRGKSTLLNALLGRTVSPVDVAPLTSTIIVIQDGAPERCEIQFQDGRREAVGFNRIATFVTEEGNPGNLMGVQAGFVYLEHPLLTLGVRLVDTPGVGSVFSLNTDVTQSFLPRIDVALLVLGGDPPITGEELDLVRAAAPRVGKLLFVMNKADLLDDETKTKAEAFSRKVLSEALGVDPGPFLCVSSRRAILGERDSGLSDLKRALEDMVTEAGPQLAALAESASSRYFADRLLQVIELERRALLTPLEEMEGRIHRFKTAVQDVKDLALAVQARLAHSGGLDPREAELRREEFLKEEEREGVRSLYGALTGARSRGEVRRLVQPMAESLARQSINLWLEQVSEELNRVVGERTSRIAEETGRLAERVEQAAADCFDVPLTPYEIRRPRPDLERIPFEFVRPTLALDPQDWLFPVLEIFLPNAVSRALALRRARSLLKVWLRTNLYAIEARRVDVLDRAIRMLQQDMMEALHHLEKSILVTLETGIQQKSLGDQAVAARLGALERQEVAVESALHDDSASVMPRVLPEQVSS